MDIPIGLREGGKDERLCDREARRALTKLRGSSVFAAPTRQALSASDYETATATNRALTGRGLSKQSWAIAPKIREVDELLRKPGAARSVLKEVHPELCFWGLAGAPMQHYKKTREGFAERLDCLSRFDPEARSNIASAFLEHGGFDADRDDIVDAYVAVLCARAADLLSTLPEEPEVDSAGLPMAMSFVEGRLLTST